MLKLLKNLHNRFPFLNSVVSLILGAVISYFFQNCIVTWKQNGSTSDKIYSCIGLFVPIIIAIVYFRWFNADSKPNKMIEKELEKNKIQRIKKEREMITNLYEEGNKQIKNDALTINEKAEIYKQITLVVTDNKRDT